MKVGKVLGYAQLHCAVAFLADFRTHTFLPSLCLRRRQEPVGPLFRQTDRAGPLFRQTDFCDTSRLTSSIRQARVRTTPFSHAFRPRFPATPKPRHSATSFSHAFRPCLPTCHSDRGRCVFVTAMCQADEPLSDISSVFPRWVGHLVSEGRQSVLKGHGHASEHLLSELEIVACLRLLAFLTSRIPATTKEEKIKGSANWTCPPHNILMWRLS